ncbi:hypothetical protein ABZX30_20170 [Streptomyces sp. NPDC004542]|uniref:hypothetical protein n=1 Tax=Streptomyces sp. NPDC004542 TaxID=3154281 RepID=UPI0033BD0BFD
MLAEEVSLDRTVVTCLLDDPEANGLITRSDISQRDEEQLRSLLSRPARTAQRGSIAP